MLRHLGRAGAHGYVKPSRSVPMVAHTLVLRWLALGAAAALAEISPPRDTGTRWALHFSTGMGKGAKISVPELLLEPPRSLAALALAERAGEGPLTPGFSYAPAEACEQAGGADKCSSGDLARAESGFGFGWFVPMGGGKAGKTHSPMVRYSNASVMGEDDGLSDSATKLSRGIRSTTVFVHTRGGGQLALASDKNAPPFLLNADPNHQRAAHSLVQKKSPPNLIWMQCGSLPNFQWMRPLLVSQIGRARADLIKGQSDSEHAAALFSSLLVHNRSKVCEDAQGTPVAEVRTEAACEDTGRFWVEGEPGTCTRMGATPVDGIGTESDCVTAGYTWTPGKDAHCIAQDGAVYEPPPVIDADGVASPAPPLTATTCQKTGYRWREAFESTEAMAKGKQPTVQKFSAVELSEALAQLVAELDAVDQDPARGELGEKAFSSGLDCGPDTAGLNAAVGDGRALVIVRARACPHLLPPPLYVSIGSKWDAKRGVTTSTPSSATPSEAGAEDGVVTAVVASEPMAAGVDDESRWESLATDEMIIIHSEPPPVSGDDVASIPSASGTEGPGVVERWCLSQLCLEEVSKRPAGAAARPVLHAAAVPAPEGAADFHRPASAHTYTLDSGVKGALTVAVGSLQGETDGWKPPAAAGSDDDGASVEGGGSGGKLAGADDWAPPSSTGGVAGGGGAGAGVTGGGLAGADNWQPPGGSATRAAPGAAAAVGGSGVLKGSLTSRPPTAATPPGPPQMQAGGDGGVGGGGGGTLSALQAEEEALLRQIAQEDGVTAMGGSGGGGVRSPRRVDTATPPPLPPPPPPPPPPPARGLAADDWEDQEQQRREKASSREQKERDRHKATQDRLARDRAFREEERLRQEEHQMKEQEAWDRASQRRRERQQAEDGGAPLPPPPPSPGRAGSRAAGGGGRGDAGAGAGGGAGGGGGPKMTMRGWLGAARLDGYHKDFEVS
jgi:hypothetical protein